MNDRKKEIQYSTEQEMFWAGEFGSSYISRNRSEQLLASNLNFFCKSLSSAHGVTSCIEFGANIGMNLRALKLLKPDIDLHAIEINADAVDELVKVVPRGQVYHTSILDFISEIPCDLALIKGVLIHLSPEVLPIAYSKLAAASARYLLVAEYYNPTPVSMPYRGHTDRLFKRDFAGEIMARHPQFKLIDYGFVYRGDPQFPQDDITWFLMEK